MHIEYKSPYFTICVYKVETFLGVYCRFRQVILCLVNGNGTEAKSSSCPADANDFDKAFALSTLHSYLTVKLEGDPRTWQTYQFVRMNITAMSSTLLTLVNDATFLARKQEVVNVSSDGAETPPRECQNEISAITLAPADVQMKYPPSHPSPRKSK